MKQMKWTLALAAGIAMCGTLQAQQVDLDMTGRIRSEALQRSQVMATLDHLTDRIGPRLTNSPAYAQASEWTRGKLSEWGLANVHEEQVDDLGRGWEFQNASVLMLGVMAVAGVPADPSIIAFALIVTAVVFAVAVIANDNLQDLKTGWLVGATPWRQQVALLIGCAVGAAVIPPVLELLYHAYGFAGALPRADMDPNAALAAAIREMRPQAALVGE